MDFLTNGAGHEDTGYLMGVAALALKLQGEGEAAPPIYLNADGRALWDALVAVGREHYREVVQAWQKGNAARQEMALHIHRALTANRQPTVSFADIAEVLPGITYLWEDWLLKGHLSMLVAEQAMGKSYLVAHLIASMTTSAPWLDG